MSAPGNVVPAERFYAAGERGFRVWVLRPKPQRFRVWVLGPKPHRLSESAFMPRVSVGLGFRPKAGSLRGSRPKPSTLNLNPQP
jgi:hypothetical protein